MKKSTYIKSVTIFILFLLTFISCKSGPENIPNDVTEAKLLQMAQSAIDDDNPDVARYYFEKMIAMFGMNHASLVVAEFELAHLDVKEGNFNEAQPALEKILTYYEDPQLAIVLPPEYKKLAQIDLAKIVKE